MKITAEYLHEKWNAFNYYDGGYIQIEVKHALEWHVGYKEFDQKALVIITQNEPELLPSSKSIVVTKGRRTDGRWTLSFVLMRNEQDSVFELLCADLISYSQTADNEISALNLTVRRFKQWNKLLEHQRKSLMDESNRKGLLGELIYLCEVIDGGYPILPAVQGWVGPDGAGDRRSPRCPEGCGVLPRGQHHRGRAHFGGARLPGRGDGLHPGSV